jgi:hypothetical protein
MQRAKTAREMDKKTFTADGAQARAGVNKGRGSLDVIIPEPTSKSAKEERSVAARLSQRFVEGESDRRGTKDADEMIDGNEGGVYTATRASMVARADARVNQTFGAWAPREQRAGTSEPGINDDGGTRKGKSAGKETPIK